MGSGETSGQRKRWLTTTVSPTQCQSSKSEKLSEKISGDNLHFLPRNIGNMFWDQEEENSPSFSGKKERETGGSIILGTWMELLDLLLRKRG